MPSSSELNPQTPASNMQTPGAQSKVQPTGRLKASSQLLQPSESWYPTPASGGLNPPTPNYNKQTPGAHKVGRSMNDDCHSVATQESSASGNTNKGRSVTDADTTSSNSLRPPLRVERSARTSELIPEDGPPREANRNSTPSSLAMAKLPAAEDLATSSGSAAASRSPARSSRTSAIKPDEKLAELNARNARNARRSLQIADGGEGKALAADAPGAVRVHGMEENAVPARTSQQIADAAAKESARPPTFYRESDMLRLNDTPSNPPDAGLYERHSVAPSVPSFSSKSSAPHPSFASSKSMKEEDRDLEDPPTAVAIEAELAPDGSVEDNEAVVNKSVPLAVAQKDSCWVFFKQNRRAQLAIFVVAFALIGMAAGLGIAFSNNDKDEDRSEEFYALVGMPLDGPNAEMNYGASISLSHDGKRMVTADLQTVRIFGLDSDEEDWVLLRDIEATNLGVNPKNDDTMIRASVVVDISRDGKYVAIGYPFGSGTEDIVPTNRGRVEVYHEDPSSTEWERLGNILYGEAAEDFFFGGSVSLSGKGGDLAIAVSVGESGDGEPVRVYLLNNGEWIPRGGNINIGGTMRLSSVSLSAFGSVLAVAGTATNSDENPAVVRIFEFKSGDWVERGEGVIGDLEGTAYQAALSADGLIVAISNYYVGPVGEAEAHSNDALDVRALEWSPAQKQWILLGEKLHNSKPGAKSGYFISLSDDGTMMAMGDPGTPGQSGGGVTGHGHIFKYDGDSWTQLGPNENGEAAGDQFGFDVSLSGDGRHFAVGAPFNRGSGVERGRVYVYDLGE